MKAVRDSITALVLIFVFAGAALGGVRKDSIAHQLYAAGGYEAVARAFRSRAEEGNASAQFSLGAMYDQGKGVPQDHAEAAKWYRRAAEQGLASAQFNLGVMYEKGEGVPQDLVEAAKWYRRAAEQGDASAQHNLGNMYHSGKGVAQDYVKAAKWYRRAAEQAKASAQVNLGVMYGKGEGVPQDYIQAHMWCNLAASRLSPGPDRDLAVSNRDIVAKRMTSSQLEQAQALARDWRPGRSTLDESVPRAAPSAPGAEGQPPLSSGTGFYVSGQGHVITNYHVVESCRKIHLRQGSAKGAAIKLIAHDKRNDLALLKAVSSPAQAALRTRKSVRPGDTVIAFGFPLAGALASSGNVTVGAVTALAGLGDDTRYLQTSAPIQPGNSGGPLLDRSGNVVGIVVSKLDALKIASITGDIPQNVNFAIKASVAAEFLDAHGIQYETASATSDKEAAAVAEQAKAFTVQVECYR